MRKIIRRGLQPLFNSRKLFNKITNKSLVIFTFHDVTDSPSEFSSQFDLNTKPAIFEMQIQFIKKHFKVIGPRDLEHLNFSESTALITFDDGFKNYFDYALPILEKYNCPSIIFLNMGAILGEVFYSSQIRFLVDKDEQFKEMSIKNYKLKHGVKEIPLHVDHCIHLDPVIVADYVKTKKYNMPNQMDTYSTPLATVDTLRKFEKHPLVFYGNHLWNHYNVLTLSKESLTDHYQKNAQALSDYENYVNFFAYPFGQPTICFNDQSNQFILGLGANKVFTAYSGINHGASKVLARSVIPTDCMNDDQFITTFNYAQIRKKFLESLGKL